MIHQRWNEGYVNFQAENGMHLLKLAEEPLLGAMIHRRRQHRFDGVKEILGQVLLGHIVGSAALQRVRAIFHCRKRSIRMTGTDE